MTKTGYGYAKCLTVAGTATSAGQMHVLKTVLVALLLDSVRRLVRGTACD